MDNQDSHHLNPKTIKEIYDFITKKNMEGQTFPTLKELKTKFLPNVEEYQGQVLVVFNSQEASEGFDCRASILMSKENFKWWNEHFDSEIEMPEGEVGIFRDLVAESFEDPYEIHCLLSTSLFEHSDIMEDILSVHKQSILKDEHSDQNGDEEDEEEEEEEEDDEEEEDEEDEEVQNTEKQVFRDKKRRTNEGVINTTRFLIGSSKKAKV